MWHRRVASLLLAAGCSVAASAPADLLEETRACLAGNLPEGSTRMEFELQSTGAGGDYGHEARFYWAESKDGLSRTRLCMTAPRDVRGLSYLVHERASSDASATELPAQTVWVYLPEEERTLRINPEAAVSRGRLARTAVHYRDLRYIPLNLSKVAPEPASTTEIGGEPVTAVRLELPPGKQNDYERIVSFVDREHCVPLRIEFYGVGGELRKLVTADPSTIAREGSVWLAHAITIEDLKQGVKTEFIVESFEVVSDLPERIFAPGSMSGHCPD